MIGQLDLIPQEPKQPTRAPLLIIVVTGTRKAHPIVHRSFVEKALDGHAQEYKNHEVTLVNGLAEGADKIARRWATSRKSAVRDFPYLGQYGRAGGFMRNQDMAIYGLGWKALGTAEVICVAFPIAGLTKSGTHDMMDRAERVGIPVFPHPLKI